MFNIVPHQTCTLSGGESIGPIKLLLPDSRGQKRFILRDFCSCRVGETTILGFDHLGDVSLFGHRSKPSSIDRAEDFGELINTILGANRIVPTQRPCFWVGSEWMTGGVGGSPSFYRGMNDDVLLVCKWYRDGKFGGGDGID